MRISLSNKVVVITGGARGIGLATARALTARGARVVIGDLDEDGARRAAKDVGAALALPLDVTDHAGFTEFLDTVEREVGPIDVLINNAGIMPIALLGDESDEMTYRVLDINIAAVIHGTREAMRRMTAARTRAHRQPRVGRGQGRRRRGSDLLREQVRGRRACARRCGKNCAGRASRSAA